ncbi:hypothetical protein WCX18_10955 [Sulfurimonas sp. HSL1-2]|uniref:hypothetical protein n=1 Tax=Thiomicrolovo zhangzhouensis TaxID=3131933 RepID=UPI0031F74752
MMVNVLLNSIGSSGKSMIAREILGANMPKAHMFEVETSNTGNQYYSEYFGSYRRIPAYKFLELNKELLLRGEVEDYIIDVSDKEVSEFVREMRRYTGVHESYHKLILPVVPTMKDILDTCKMLNTLICDIGVPASNVYVIFNRLEDGCDIEKKFALVYVLKESLGFHTSDNLSLLNKDVFFELEQKGLTSKALMESKEDYARLSLEETDPVKANEYALLHLLCANVKGLYKKNKRIFDWVMASPEKIFDAS